MTVRVFLSGQSNALGRGEGGPSWSSIDSRVRVWNNVNPLGANGSSFVSPATALAGGTFDNTNRNNLGVWFCDRMAHHLNEAVDMTIVARGATAIESWLPGGSYPMLQECIDVWAATGQDPANIFLWHQGEGAVTEGGDYPNYRADFTEVVGLLKAGGVIDDDTLIILGGTAEENSNRINFNQYALRRLATDLPNCTYASSEGLLTYDGTHFTGETTTTFGADRYFNAYLGWAYRQKEANIMDIWALVNEGGTPGVQGTGENKVANIGPLLAEGYRLKGAPIYFTSDGTYTPSEGTDAILVEVQGPGGGGAGASSASTTARVGGGGGAGGYAKKWIEQPEASYAVEVGLGGSGGASGQNHGNPGTKATKIGTIIECNPGSGGISSGTGSTTALVTGGDGGVATGGDINIDGQSGWIGIKVSAGVRSTGAGANSPLGTGGKSASFTSDTSSAAGLDASGFGAGGSGATSSTTTGQAGGSGSSGVVIIWEYVKG